ncbi:hypothetical protein [Bacillus altitudinis]
MYYKQIPYAFPNPFFYQGAPFYRTNTNRNQYRAFYWSIDYINAYYNCLQSNSHEYCYRALDIPIDTPVPSPPFETTPQPNVEDVESFDSNGKRYICKWVYCCSPVESATPFPKCQKPTTNDSVKEIVFFEEKSMPEFKAERCHSPFGFCLYTRKSVFRVIARVIYPKNIEDLVRNEIDKCFQQATQQALLSITPLIATMVGAPETIPATLPLAVQTAFENGMASFKNCIYQNQLLTNLYNSGKLKYCIFHVQERGNGNWSPLTANDILNIFERLAFYQIAGPFAYIPGVGSFDDLAKTIGIDSGSLSKNINIGLTSFGERGQKIINQLSSAGSAGIASASQGLSKIGQQISDGVTDIVRDPVKNLSKRLGIP